MIFLEPKDRKCRASWWNQKSRNPGCSLSCKGFRGPCFSLLLSSHSLSLSSSHLHSDVADRSITCHHAGTTFSENPTVGFFKRQTLMDTAQPAERFSTRQASPSPGNSDGGGGRKEARKRGDGGVHPLGSTAGGEATVGTSTADWPRDSNDGVISGSPGCHTGCHSLLHVPEKLYPAPVHVLPFQWTPSLSNPEIPATSWAVRLPAP